MCFHDIFFQNSKHSPPVISPVWFEGIFLAPSRPLRSSQLSLLLSSVWTSSKPSFSSSASPSTMACSATAIDMPVLSVSCEPAEVPLEDCSWIDPCTLLWTSELSVLVGVSISAANWACRSAQEWLHCRPPLHLAAAPPRMEFLRSPRSRRGTWCHSGSRWRWQVELGVGGALDEEA